MKVLIITNESEIFLVQDDNGRHSRRYAQLSEEESSGMVPAKELFGGRFTEVRSFRDRISRKVYAEMAIITKGNGLIEGRTLIKPYLGYVSTYQDICDTEEKYALCENLRKMMDGYHITIFCIPKNILSFFIDRDVFSIKSKIIFITSRDLDIRLHNDSYILLPRRGARVGRDNAQKIEQILYDV